MDQEPGRKLHEADADMAGLAEEGDATCASSPAMLNPKATWTQDFFGAKSTSKPNDAGLSIGVHWSRSRPAR